MRGHLISVSGRVFLKSQFHLKSVISYNHQKYFRSRAENENLGKLKNDITKAYSDLRESNLRHFDDGVSYFHAGYFPNSLVIYQNSNKADIITA